MIVASWNVNSISVRLPQVLDWLDEVQPDVLCLQETKVVDEKFPSSALAEHGYNALFRGQRTYNGVAIVFKAKAQVRLITNDLPESPLPEHCRFLVAEIDDITIMNSYIPNGGEVGSDKYADKLSWFGALRRYLDNNFSPADRSLLCGDFNVAPEDRDVYDPEATRGGILVSDEERAALANVKAWGFEDAFRMHESESGHYTWWDYRMMAFRRKMGFRIDHIWLSKGLAPECSRSWIDIKPRKNDRPSDHTPILCEF